MELAQISQSLHLLPGRFGPRPRSSVNLPFRPLDQFPPPETIDRLLVLSLEIPHVRMRESRVAAPGCRALWLPDGQALGPPEAFIDGHEFCHLHPGPAGAIHLTLPPAVVENVVALGWAERHPVHRMGVWKALVMVYAPRDEAELVVALNLIEHSCRFAMGAGAGAPMMATASASTV